MSDADSQRRHRSREHVAKAIICGATSWRSASPDGRFGLSRVPGDHNGSCPAHLQSIDARMRQRIVNLMGAWHSQLIECSARWNSRGPPPPWRGGARDVPGRP